MKSLLAALALTLAAPVAPAGADDAPTPVQADPAQQLSLQSFGAANPSCLEWGDACFICSRDSAGAAKCSTAGVACVPQDIACKRTAAAP